VSFKLVFAILEGVRWPECCWWTVPWCWPGDCKCTITKVGLWTWIFGGLGHPHY